jgi:DNA-binding beta-propeller fold protein YncE
VDGSGNVYIADSGFHMVVKVTPGGTMSPLVGDGSTGTPTNGLAILKRLNYPKGVAVDASGTNVYIADAGNNMVEKVAGGQLSIIANTAGLSGAATEGLALSSKLHNPTGVAVDAWGNLYIADQGNNVVEKVAGGQLSIFAGGLSLPAGLAVDGVGNVYISDYGDNKVAKVSRVGHLSVVAGTGTSGIPTAGLATDSDMYSPQGVAVDSAGNVFVADTGNATVETLVAAG